MKAMKRFLMITAALVALTGPASAEMPREIQGRWCVRHTATALDIGTRGPCRHPEDYEDTMTITAEGYEFEGLACKHMRTVKIGSRYSIKVFCVPADQPLIQTPTTDHPTAVYGIVRGNLLIDKNPR